MPVLTRNARRLSRPTLPTELVDQILHDPVLDMFDLAKCCRVSQNFLLRARPALYHSINISLITTNEEELDNLSLNERGRQLLDSVSASPSLGRLTRRINVEGYCSELLQVQEAAEACDNEEERAEFQDVFESLVERCRLSDPFEIDKPEKNVHTFEDPAEVIDLFLKAMPLATSLTMNADLWRYDSIKKSVVGQGDRLVELDVSGQDTKGRFDCKGDEALKLTRLERLRCSADYSFQAKASLPDNLQILDICDGSDLSRFHFSPSSQLRVLRVSASEESLSQIVNLRHLERLYFKLPAHYSDKSTLRHPTLSAFAKHPHLQFLSMQLANATSNGLTALPLLSHLPTSLIRVDFPSAIPYDALFALLRSESTPSLRIIGVRRSFMKQQDNVASTSNLQMLQTLCKEKGLRLEWSKRF
ncbi:hypothetical protein JCM5353_007659 [Sporobolomyces roseus]